ncbi:MAG: FHA domain-containing protein [Myxococcales bacterium]
MTRLFFRSADGQERTLELASTATVGSAEADLVLADPSVAGRHCRFTLDARGAVWLEDLGSTTGTYLAGQKIADKVQVPEGAAVTLGRWTATVDRALVLVVASPRKLFSHPLDQDRVLVGSGPTADLLIDHPSVSARHAQLSKVAGKLSLLDLGSSGGTFVNGSQVSTATVEPGDVLRFGEIEVTFAGAVSKAPAILREPERAHRAAVPPAPRRLRGGVGVLVAGLLVAGGIGLLVLAEPGVRPLFPASSHALDDDPTPPVKQTAAVALMAKCLALADPESGLYDLEQCAVVCEHVQELDPGLNARSKARRCRREHEDLAVLRQAELTLASGKAEQARDLLEQIPLDSRVLPKAQTVHHEAGLRAAEQAKTACRADLDAKDFKSAYLDSCRRAMEATCNRPGGPEEETAKGYQVASRQVGRAHTPFTCPPEWGQPGWRGPLRPTRQDLASIRHMHPRPELSDVATQYLLSGDPMSALKQLQQSELWGLVPPLSDVKELARDLQTLELHHHRLSDLLRGVNDPVALVEDFARLEQAEQRVLPAPLESPVLRDARKQLTEALRDRLGRAKGTDRYPVILAQYRLDRADPALTQQLAQLEREALSILQEWPACEGARAVLDMTLAESPVHRQALQRVQEKGCPERPQPKPF